VFTPHTAHVSCLLARAQSLPAVAPSQAGVSRFQSETEPRVLHLVVRHTQRRLHFRHRRLALHRARRPPRRCRPRGAVRSERCGRQPRAQSVARRHHPPGRCRCLQACPNALQACGRHRCAALLDAAALSTPAGSHSAASQPVGASPLSTLSSQVHLVSAALKPIHSDRQTRAAPAAVSTCTPYTRCWPIAHTTPPSSRGALCGLCRRGPHLSTHLRRAGVGWGHTHTVRVLGTHPAAPLHGSRHAEALSWRPAPAPSLPVPSRSASTCHAACCIASNHSSPPVLGLHQPSPLNAHGSFGRRCRDAAAGVHGRRRAGCTAWTR
jgi:hypothetical protein